MSNIKRNIEYKDLQDNKWALILNDPGIEIQCHGEARTYEIDDIINLEHDGEYVFLYEFSIRDFYQVKFEEDKYLVIDKFTEKGEYLRSIGSHVFGG